MNKGITCGAGFGFKVYILRNYKAKVVEWITKKIYGTVRAIDVQGKK